MKIEDFKYELISLRDLAHANGRERVRLIRALLRYSPGDYTRFRVWVAMVVIIGGIAAGLIAGIRGENPFPILLCVGLAGVGSAAIGYRAARKRRVDSLIALSEKLNARASELDEAEFDAICRSMIYVPESLFEEEKPVNLCCGCVRCAKMLPADSECCPECGNERLIYGDSECLLDEARLQRIHNLLL